MPKKRVTCPDCAHRFTVEMAGQQTKTVGVRSRRVTGNQFEYTITTPGQMTGDGRLTTVTDDLILSGALSFPVGAAFGLVASLAVPDYIIEMIGLGASVGGTVAWGWLCAEHNQRLKRVLPWFMEQKEAWAEGNQMAKANEVTLTIDTRNEYDGYTSKYFGPLPIEIARFNKWARAALEGQSVAINKWTGANGEFNRTTEYEPLLAIMRSANVVKNQPGKGNILTIAGSRALRQHLKAHPLRARSNEVTYTTHPPTPPKSVHSG